MCEVMDVLTNFVWGEVSQYVAWPGEVLVAPWRSALEILESVTACDLTFCFLVPQIK